MKLTVLGSGTVVPSATRNSAGYFVESPHLCLMIDCGAGTLHALARYGLPWEMISHIFISHFHLDHVGELASLFFAFKYGMRHSRSEPLTIIGPDGLDRVMKGLSDAFGAQLFEPDFDVQLRMLKPGQKEQLAAGYYLSVAKTPHTPESLAVRIDGQRGSICYTGDTGYSQLLPQFFKEADLLISECSFQKRREGIAHLSIKDAACMAELARVARLLVTHFYFDFDETELKHQLQKYFSGEVIIGSDGLSIEI
jgi:ribonuclease BN (tRNA processing enzyme)